MSTRGWLVSSAALVALITSGCEQEPVTALKPCPTGGIALGLQDTGPAVLSDQAAPGQEAGAAASGAGECSGGMCGTPMPSCTSTSCQHVPAGPPIKHVAEYKSYACSAPQICPDMYWLRVRHDVAAGPLEMGFLLLNCSTGDQPLRIDEVVVLGDPRCAFSDVGPGDISDRVLQPGETAAIRLYYDPAAAGEDHAVLAVRTNAENDAVVHLRVCGLATTAPPASGDRSLDELRCGGSATSASCHK